MPTTYEVHPAIGIARVGSSGLLGEEGYFIGPEPDGISPQAYRDPAGDLKRQAARFRIFRCSRDDNGRLLDACEVDPRSIRRIVWTVHLANRKGVARRIYSSGPGFRNCARGDDAVDRELIIDPGPVSVSEPGERRRIDTGRFRSTVVPLGEILMEPTGRLLVLGGYGASGSDPFQSRLDPIRGHRADNNDWFDDTSDGSVLATIQLLDGTTTESAAWVIVAPPDFAPGIANQVTLYDILYDLAVKRGLISPPTSPARQLSFTRHVQPILSRAMGYRWVNRAARFGAAGDGIDGHGPGGRGDFAAMWEMLSDPSPLAETLRKSLAGRLRNPDPAIPPPAVNPLTLIPRLTDAWPRRHYSGEVLRLTGTQYEVMQAWAKGEFEGDWGRAEILAEGLPDALDRVALEACVGGPLQPGIEANGMVLCDSRNYMDGEPFRLSHVAVRPGQVTEYNAVPWQADYVTCQWEEMGGPWPKRLGWWPAQRPDDVFPTADAEAMVPWARGLNGEFYDMVEKWDRLGFVVDKGPPGNPFFAEDERDVQAVGP